MDNNNNNKRMKKGIMAGVVALVIAKITHLVGTGAIGIIFLLSLTPEHFFYMVAIVDSPIVGLIWLIVVTRWVYKFLTEEGLKRRRYHKRM